MSTHHHDASARTARTVEADVTVNVSRDAAGSLADGVEKRLARADGVAVEAFEPTAVQPGLNDLTVEVAAELRIAPDVEDTAARLNATFGVETERVAPADRLRTPPDDAG